MLFVFSFQDTASESCLSDTQRLSTKPEGEMIISANSQWCQKRL